MRLKNESFASYSLSQRLRAFLRGIMEYWNKGIAEEASIIPLFYLFADETSAILNAGKMPALRYAGEDTCAPLETYGIY